MARLDIIFCDLCKNISKVNLPFGLTLQSGKGKNKEITKAEICQHCYDKLISRIESEFDFNKSLSTRSRKDIGRVGFLPSADKIEIADGESIVPSIVDNVAPPQEAKCSHEKSSVVDNDTSYTYFKCKDCGEEWKV